MRKFKISMAGIIIIGCLFLFNGTAVAGDFIKTFLCRIGGEAFDPGDEIKMAKYDKIFTQKFLYTAIGGDTWGAIKAINPNTEIYCYTQVNNVDKYSDQIQVQYLNNLGRYNISRDHSMGTLNGNHPDFFLLNSSGNRVVVAGDEDTNFLDFGNSSFRAYSSEAILTDFVGRPWAADGIYSDHCVATIGDVASIPAKYNTDAAWSPAMNGMLNAMAGTLHARGQKFACNRGCSRDAEGYNAWLALDALSSPPDVLLEEGAFAVSWGPRDVQFYPEDQWKRQVDVLASIENSDVCFMSHIDLSVGGSGTDNYGKSFNYWDALWYSLGSYLLGKNDALDNAYFMFRDARSYNCVDYYVEEYDKIDLGPAVGGYHVTSYNGINIYWREFAEGYVYVNSTYKDVTSISLPGTCKQLTHYNLNEDPEALPDINTISLIGHRTAILYKSHSSPVVPPLPPVLRVKN